MWLALALINVPLTCLLLPVLPLFLWYSHVKGSIISRASQALQHGQNGRLGGAIAGHHGLL